MKAKPANSSKTIATVQCNCTNEYQDKKYGRNARIANRLNKNKPGDGMAYVRCTVCSRIHSVSEGRMR